MLDVALLRKDPEGLAAAMIRRGIDDFDLDGMIALDAQRGE